MTKSKVALVPFPFDDLSITKVRPALCLTDPIGTHRHVVLAFITSTIPADLIETDFVINPTHAGFGMTGLRVSSTLRLHRLMTVAVSLIERELGSISSDMQNNVDEKLRKLFKLV